MNDKQATFHVKRRKSNVEKNKTIKNSIYNLQPSCAITGLLWVIKNIIKKNEMFNIITTILLMLLLLSLAFRYIVLLLNLMGLVCSKHP